MVEDKLVKSEATLEEATNQINRFELERSSTPDILCEHCDHDHGKECCLYVGDDHSDILRYSNFKKSIDEKYWTMETSDDFDLKWGSVTPRGHPTYTRNFYQGMYSPTSAFFLPQYFMPLVPPVLSPSIQHMNLLQNSSQMTSYPPSMHQPLPSPYIMHHYPMQVERPNYFQQAVESNFVPPCFFLPPPSWA